MASPVTTMDIHLAEGTRVEGYRIVRQLGRGTMGVVYEALDEEDQAVALKFIRFGPVRDRDALSRFQREAKLCATFDNPHIVPVTGYGVYRNVPFIVMRKLVGSSLQDWLSRTGALAPPVAVSIAIEACIGVASAHAAGVVHRDLTPANVFIDEGGLAVRTVVCDFGVAKLVDDDGSLTVSGDVLGTPMYMAPEQFFDSKHVDARSDVWALAMVLYHALAGRPAFHAAKSVAELSFLLDRCATGAAVPHLQDAAPWVDASLTRVIHAALLPRERRFASAEELLEAIRSWGPSSRALEIGHLVSMPAALRMRVEQRAQLPGDRAELLVGTSDGALYATTRDVSPASRSSTTLGNRYLLHGKLGAGEGSVLYDADDQMTGRSVAIAIGSAPTDPAVPARGPRFLRRARLVESLDSPFAMKVLTAGTDTASGVPYIVVERLRGRDLSDLLRAHGRLAPEAAVTLIVQACGAVERAHALGLVHGAIEPSKMFVAETSSGTATMKLRGFVSANERSPEVDRPSGAPMPGSSTYLAPEQAGAQSVDARVDVWGLSLALHEALSGEPPWTETQTHAELIDAVCTRDLPPLDIVVPGLDPQLAAVVARGVARDPANRFATPGELASALRPFGLRRALQVNDLASAPSRVVVDAAAAGSERGVASRLSMAGVAGASADETPIALPMRHRPPGMLLAVVALLVGLVVIAVIVVR